MHPPLPLLLGPVMFVKEQSVNAIAVMGDMAEVEE
jgi:hypothetical protein